MSGHAISALPSQCFFTYSTPTGDLERWPHGSKIPGFRARARINGSGPSTPRLSALHGRCLRMHGLRRRDAAAHDIPRGARDAAAHDIPRGAHDCPAKRLRPHTRPLAREKWPSEDLEWWPPGFRPRKKPTVMVAARAGLPEIVDPAHQWARPVAVDEHGRRNPLDSDSCWAESFRR